MPKIKTVPRPVSAGRDVESTDLGDMLELRSYDIGRDRVRFRWDASVDGEHRVVTRGEWWSPNDPDALPRLEAMRDRAREIFRSGL